MYAYESHPLYCERRKPVAIATNPSPSRSSSSGFPVGPREGEVIEAHGCTFAVTSLHTAWKMERWDSLRGVGDPLADAALKAGLGCKDPPKGPAASAPRDALAELMDASKSTGGDANLKGASTALLSHLETVPAWVDFEAVERGQRFYLRHLPLASLSLLHLGLVAGFGAPRIHPTLQATGYLTSLSQPGRTRRRVFETTRFVSECLGSEKNCLRPGGAGWAACVKVRLLHATVRARILGKSRTKSAHRWDTEALGVPVCTADVVATQLGFAGCTLLGLANAGVRFTREEANDFIHLWRVIGHWVGVPEEHNACAPAPLREVRKTDAATSSGSSGDTSGYASGYARDTGDASGDAFSRSTAALEMVAHLLLEPTNEGSRALAVGVLGAVGAGFPLTAPPGVHAAWALRLMGPPLVRALALPGGSGSWWWDRARSLAVSGVILLSRVLAAAAPTASPPQPQPQPSRSEPEPPLAAAWKSSRGAALAVLGLLLLAWRRLRRWAGAALESRNRQLLKATLARVLDDGASGEASFERPLAVSLAKPLAAASASPASEEAHFRRAGSCPFA